MVEHTFLCVGGPLAGKRHYEPIHNQFRAVVTKPQYATFEFEIKHIDYRVEIFRSQDGDISVWIPQGQTLLETMKLLLEAYARDARVQNKAEWEK